MTTHAFLPPYPLCADALFTCKAYSQKTTSPTKVTPPTCEAYVEIRRASSVAFDSASYSVGGPQ